MKIIYIAPQPIPSPAANSIHVMKMVQALGRLGHDVTLCFQKGSGPSSEICNTYGVDAVFKMAPRHHLPGRNGSFIYAFQNARFSRLEKPDMVLSRHLPSAWLCALFSLPVLFEIHDSPDALSAPAKKIFDRLAARKNVRFIAISQALAAHLQKDYGIAPNKILLAPDAAEPLPPAAPTAPFEKPRGSFHAGYTGHLYKGRGLEIIGAMAAGLPAVTFHIVGGRPQDIAEWQNNFAALKNIKFHGHVPHAEVGNYLQHFDALLAPYQNNVSVAGNTGNTGRWMSPLKIFEYMAAGKPILCSDLPVLREILDDQTARLCPPADATSWIAALADLQNDLHSAARLGANALEKFTSRYTWKKRAENIVSFAAAS